MATVKDAWKKVGSDIGDIGNDIANSDLGKNVKKLGVDFGKSVVTTVKHGIRAVSEWAASDDDEFAAEAESEVIYAEAPAEETVAEAAEEAAETVEKTVENVTEEVSEAAEEVAEKVDNVVSIFIDPDENAEKGNE